MNDGMESEAASGNPSAASKRRRWSLAEKLAMVAEANSPTTNASAVARCHGVKPAQLYRWKKSLAFAGATTLDGPALCGPNTHMGLTPDGMVPASIIEVELANGRSLRVHGAIDPSILCRLVAALES